MPVPCNFEDFRIERIAIDFVDGVKISTVFVGVGCLFETMILGGKNNGLSRRSESYDEALKNHNLLKSKIISGINENEEEEET